MEVQSEFEKSLQDLGVLPPAEAPDAQGKQLGLNMEIQQQSNWCWAAVATSVSRFYNPGSPWLQCTLVNAELGQWACCQNGNSPACNQPWYLDRALARTNHFVAWANGPTPLAAVMAELNNGRPVGVRIGWFGGGGHFVVVDAYSNTGMVDVEDPYWGHSTIPVNTLSTAYRSAGAWTHTYTTRP